jgi:hypothetical protein
VKYSGSCMHGLYISLNHRRKEKQIVVLSGTRGISKLATSQPHAHRLTPYIRFKKKCISSTAVIFSRLICSSNWWANPTDQFAGAPFFMKLGTHSFDWPNRWFNLFVLSSLFTMSSFSNFNFLCIFEPPIESYSVVQNELIDKLLE